MENERPTPLVDDIEATRRKLESWFSTRRDTPVKVTDLNIPEGTGMSNVTLLFDIHWEESGETRTQSCVGRLQPEIDKPVFPTYDLSLQYQVMDAVGKNSDVPVPILLGLETSKDLLGVQFYIMEFTAGRIPTDMPPYNMDGWMMHETSDSQRANLWRSAVEVMARFHQLDYKSLGFAQLAKSDRSALQQQLEYWQGYHDWAFAGVRHEAGQAALDWLWANQPENENTVLCWGDSRIGNIIFKESLDGVAAVLDWEMAVLGNPVQDLAWFNYMDSTFAEGLGMPRLSGLPSYEETIAQWEEATGWQAEHYDYYLVFAAMRYGLLLSRIMLASGQENELQDNFAVQLLNKHLKRLDII